MRNLSFRPFSIVLGILAIAVVQSVYFYPLLPERLATHFGIDGRADGWMGKDSFFLVYAAILLMEAVLLGGIGLWLPKVPTEMINLPNKEYWLTPERREASLAAVGQQMLSFTAATLVLLVTVFQLTFQANLLAEPRLDSRAIWILFAYLGYAAVWTVSLIRRFALPKS